MTNPGFSSHDGRLFSIDIAIGPRVCLSLPFTTLITMGDVILRRPITPEDTTWEFIFPAMALRQSKKPGVIHGKMLSLQNDGIKLSTVQFPSNRILNADDPTKFILLTIEKRFRFEDQPLRVATDYIIRMLKKGVHLNGVQYRFYGHSNSQLVCLILSTSSI